MKWFELGSDRGQIADQIMTGSAEKVCDGYERTMWDVAHIGSYIMLHSYAQRNVYDAEQGCWVALPHPFYRAQISYQTSSYGNVSAIIDFNREHAMLVRSSEASMPDGRLPDPFAMWDEAMAAVDEALHYQAHKLGILVTAPMIERVPAESYSWAA